VCAAEGRNASVVSHAPSRPSASAGASTSSDRSRGPRGEHRQQDRVAEGAARRRSAAPSARAPARRRGPPCGRAPDEAVAVAELPRGGEREARRGHRHPEHHGARVDVAVARRRARTRGPRRSPRGTCGRCARRDARRARGRARVGEGEEVRREGRPRAPRRLVRPRRGVDRLHEVARGGSRPSARGRPRTCGRAGRGGRFR
jgi:hypothetical protein